MSLGLVSPPSSTPQQEECGTGSSLSGIGQSPGTDSEHRRGHRGAGSASKSGANVVNHGGRMLCSAIRGICWVSLGKLRQGGHATSPSTQGRGLTALPGPGGFGESEALPTAGNSRGQTLPQDPDGTLGWCGAHTQFHTRVARTRLPSCVSHCVSTCYQRPCPCT